MKLTDILDDTTRQATWERIEYFRNMSGEERFILTCRMSDAKRAEVAAKIRERHPDYSAEQAKFAEIRLRLGDELFYKAFPDAHVPQCDECCESLRSMWDS